MPPPEIHFADIGGVEIRMQSQTKVFSDLARDYMNANPLAVTPEDTVRHVVAAMTDRRQRAAMVVDGDGRLRGILTDQDVTRRVAMRCTGDEAIVDVMTDRVVSVEADDYVFHAIARMRRAGWRHLPVVDDAGRPVGMLELESVLARASGLMMELIDDASRERSLPGLGEVKSAQIDLVDRLLADSVPAPEILALVSHINSDIHHRIVTAHLNAMREEGLGGTASAVLRHHHGFRRPRRELSLPGSRQRLHPRRLSGRGPRQSRRVLHQPGGAHDGEPRPSRVSVLPRLRDGNQSGVAEEPHAVARADQLLGPEAQHDRCSILRYFL